MAVNAKIMDHVWNNRKEPLVNRPGITVTVSITYSLVNADDVLLPYGNTFEIFITVLEVYPLTPATLHGII